jgi:hypothetical protein
MSNRALRILNCLHRSEFGGAHRRVVWVAQELKKKSIDTIILFPLDKNVQYENYLSDQKLQFVRPFLPVIRKSIFSILSFLVTLPLVVRKIVKIITLLNIRIVHVNSATNLQPVLAALIKKCQVIWHWNDTLTPKWYIRIVSFLLKSKKISLAIATPYILEYYGIEHLESFILLAAIPPNSGNKINFKKKIRIKKWRETDRLREPYLHRKGCNGILVSC